jgi:hypothetical protein
LIFVFLILLLQIYSLRAQTSREQVDSLLLLAATMPDLKKNIDSFARTAWARLSAKSQVRSTEPETLVARRKKKTTTGKKATLKRRSIYYRYYGTPQRSAQFSRPPMLSPLGSAAEGGEEERQQVEMTSPFESFDERQQKQQLPPPLPPRPQKYLARNSLDSYSEELNQIFSVLESPDMHSPRGPIKEPAAEGKKQNSFESLLLGGRINFAEQSVASLTSRLGAAERDLADFVKSVETLKTDSQGRLESLETGLGKLELELSAAAKWRDDLAEPFERFVIGLRSAVDLFYEALMALLIVWFSMLLVAKILRL